MFPYRPFFPRFSTGPRNLSGAAAAGLILPVADGSRGVDDLVGLGGSFVLSKVCLTFIVVYLVSPSWIITARNTLQQLGQLHGDRCSAVLITMAIRDHLSTAHIVGASLGVYLVAHRLYRVFYDLRLHPLSHIPGPKLAAITYLYQTYYSLVGGSRFYIQVGKLHEQYGMSRTPKSF